MKRKAARPHLKASPVLQGLAILVVALAPLVVHGQSGPQAARPAAWLPPGVWPQFDLITHEEGWLQAGHGLFWTRDGGSSWELIGPALDAQERVLATAFVSRTNTWLVTGLPAGDGGAEIVLHSTVDGGRHWARRVLDLLSVGDPRRDVESAHVAFLDDRTGWLVLGQRTSANFSVGTLFATTDGGKSWEERPLPFAEPVLFVSADRGWVAGGAAGDGLYATTDGGRSWAAQTLPIPRDRGRISVGRPAFANPQNGVVPVLVSTEATATFESYVTSDGGASWRRIGRSSVSPLVSEASLVPFSAQTDGSWFWTDPGIGRTFRGTSAGEAASAASSDPWSAGIKRLDMVDAEVGWALYSDRPCDDQECRLKRAILATTDAGQSWIPLELPRIEGASSMEGAPSGSAESAARVTGLTATMQGQGFDKCEIPTLAQLSAWATANPRGYQAVNLYIGGSARSCSNAALTASYVQQISNQGWKFIPTWVDRRRAVQASPLA